ncbi:alpha/beta-hydrolase [Corynespora cassiicola Philippines]|uniref:Alpha/beta-hydrolase n=1 Tax=Corynespora cassiicola Philippines TaxID=1448308 RepID=A0A2T2N471_CORCC|nr:alpha/beta-hydrolase [Corynespora cassiicola Philippines]
MIGIVQPDNVVQFRAIPYATLPARFKQSVLLDRLPEGKTDFTKPGFACPHIFGADIFSGGPRPDEPPLQSSEFSSLILQLNAPLSTLQSLQADKDGNTPAKLPVMVYIHGGGFVLGKIDQNHNAAYMVEHSIATAQPVIGISIQYRVGALGFLGTPDGGRNFGLYDQRNALAWVRRFVGGFGGDAGRTTAWGESAGAMSICFHMLMRPPPGGPLFDRVILMSGVLGPLGTPVRRREAEETYEKALKILEIKERGEEGLEKARSVEVERIHVISNALTDEGGIWLPIEDEMLPYFSWEDIPRLLGECDWVNDIVLGTTGFEGLTMLNNANAMTPSTFLDGIAKQLGDSAAATIAEAYNVTRTMDQNLFLTSAMRWIGDVVFDGKTYPTILIFLTISNIPSPKRVYRYVFDVGNPFPNHTLYQLPHHWVDVYFVFRSLQFRYPSQRLKMISDQHASYWIDFGNGNAPWTEYKHSGDGKEIIAVAELRDGWVERTVAEDERVTELSWKRVEKLYDAWSAAKGSQFRPLSIDPLLKKRFV